MEENGENVDGNSILSSESVEVATNGNSYEDSPSTSSGSKKEVWDKYCWACHEIDTELFCKTCIRSYHKECVKYKKRDLGNEDNYKCQLCVELRSVKCKKGAETENLNGLLKFVIKRLLDDSEVMKSLLLYSVLPYSGNRFIEFLTPFSARSESIINPMSLEIMKEKVYDAKYRSKQEFMTDILWIRHSCYILHNGDKNMIRKLCRLTKYCHSELYTIDLCTECFRNANESTDNWFTKVCKYPHLLVWTRMHSTSSFWPAKAMGIKKVAGEDRIHVLFFGNESGEERNAFVNQSNCFLFSLNPPKGHHAGGESRSNSIQEVDEHIERIKEKFGEFCYAAKPLPFQPEEITARLRNMIPNLKINNIQSINSFKFETFNMTFSQTRINKENLNKLSIDLSKYSIDLLCREASVALERIDLSKFKIYNPDKLENVQDDVEGSSQRQNEQYNEHQNEQQNEQQNGQQNEQQIDNIDMTTTDNDEIGDAPVVEIEHINIKSDHIDYSDDDSQYSAETVIQNDSIAIDLSNHSEFAPINTSLFENEGIATPIIENVAVDTQDMNVSTENAIVNDDDATENAILPLNLNINNTFGTETVIRHVSSNRPRIVPTQEVIEISDDDEEHIPTQSTSQTNSNSNVKHELSPSNGLIHENPSNSQISNSSTASDSYDNCLQKLQSKHNQVLKERDDLLIKLADAKLKYEELKLKFDEMEQINEKITQEHNVQIDNMKSNHEKQFQDFEVQLQAKLQAKTQNLSNLLVELGKQINNLNFSI